MLVVVKMEAAVHRGRVRVWAPTWAREEAPKERWAATVCVRCEQAWASSIQAGPATISDPASTIDHRSLHRDLPLIIPSLITQLIAAPLIQPFRPSSATGQGECPSSQGRSSMRRHLPTSMLLKLPALPWPKYNINQFTNSPQNN